MSQLFGVGLDIEVKRINMQFKMQIVKRGGIALRSIWTIFRQFDQNGNKKLDQQEFTDALSAFGLFPKIIEVQALMKFYDIDGDGKISYEEFVKGLREPLSERRCKMVEKAFSQLDRDRSGKITVADIITMYDVSRNKDYINGSKSREQILEEFLEGFEAARGTRNSQVTWQEFLDYYTDLSMCVTDDRHFVELIESRWQITEDEEASVTKQEIEFLTKSIRSKLITATNNNQDEYVLRGIFKDFDTNKSGNLSIDELTEMLGKLQISADRKYITALLKKFDTNGNGVIEFEEFCQFLIKNPYK